jgi:hypothetical protein
MLVQCSRDESGGDCVRRRELRRGSVIEGTVRAFGAVALAVLLSEHASFEKTTEELSVQQVLAERSARAFDLSVLPRSARLDESRFGTQGGQVVLDGLTINSGPLLLRRKAGPPRSAIRRSRIAIMSVEMIDRPTSRARHSRVNSSITGIHFSRRLSSVASMAMCDRP